MANILDIFRTRAGHLLVEKSIEITGMEDSRIQQALTCLLPSLLSIYAAKDISEIKMANENLISFLKNVDLIHQGKEEAELLLTDAKKNSFLHLSEVLEVEEDSFKKLFYVSIALLSQIISEMKNKAGNDLDGILKTLSGTHLKYHDNFISILSKDSTEPGIIDNVEEISLGKQEDDEDPSILGGYTGGR